MEAKERKSIICTIWVRNRESSWPNDAGWRSRQSDGGGSGVGLDGQQARCPVPAVRGFSGLDFPRALRRALRVALRGPCGGFWWALVGSPGPRQWQIGLGVIPRRGKTSHDMHEAGTGLGFFSCCPANDFNSSLSYSVSQSGTAATPCECTADHYHHYRNHHHYKIAV